MDSLLPLEGPASRPKLKAAPNDAKPREDGGAEAFEAALADASEEPTRADTDTLTKDAELLTDSPIVSALGNKAEANEVSKFDLGETGADPRSADVELLQQDVRAAATAQADTPIDINAVAQNTTRSEGDSALPDVTPPDIAKGDPKPQTTPAEILARADAIEATNSERRSLADTDAAVPPASDPQKLAAPAQAESETRTEVPVRETVQADITVPKEAAKTAPNAAPIAQTQTAETAAKTAPASEPAARTDLEAAPDAPVKTETAFAEAPNERLTPTPVLTDAPTAPADVDPRIQPVANDPAAETVLTAKADVDSKGVSDAQLAADAQLNKQTANLTANALSGEGGKPVELATAAVSTASSAPATSIQSTIATPAGMQAQQAVLVASPSDIPEIVSRVQAGGSEDGDQRVLVRLDPPELGKVSIDFKFDAQGLQHVTITAETPEAIKRLREMHFELVQGLEQSGLSGQDMTFRQETPNQTDPRQWASNAVDEPGQATRDADLRIAMDTLSGTTGHRDASGRLNIRL